MNIWEELQLRMTIRRFIKESRQISIKLSHNDLDLIWEAAQEYIKYTKNMAGKQLTGGVTAESIIDKLEAEGDQAKFTEDELRSIHFTLTHLAEVRKMNQKEISDLKKRIRSSIAGPTFESMGSGNNTSGGEAGGPEETEVEETY